uniref:Anoctamin n=1 Tax=Panagrolaimus sp. PS1159 TaxID=55785 RepID=A0AC35F864_9BILA
MDIDYVTKNPNLETCSDRQLLYECWARPKNILKYQPLYLIQQYFGTQLGLYYAWLGFYTQFLSFIAIIGVICIFFGFFTISSDVPSNDICSPNGIGSQVLICPNCDYYCDYMKLSGSCIYAKITYIFDNTSTIFFAAVMSIWATLFLECWKRYHEEIAYKWKIRDIELEDEVMRPEFQYRNLQQRINPVTQHYEPYLPPIEKFIRLFGSGITVLFFLCLVIAFVIGITVYRVIMMQVFHAMEGNQFFQSQAIIIVSFTVAIINLIFILIMNYAYTQLALKLTDWECPKTQTEFDDSYTVKVFLFQFVNYYASLFYIAFIKGRLSGVPGYETDTPTGRKIKIDGYRLEECDPTGCMVELVIQLLIIMCGQQLANAFIEMGYPKVMQWLQRYHLKVLETKKTRRRRECEQRRRDLCGCEDQPKKLHFGITLYEQDLALSANYEQFLFDEYLEMVLQFGFVTLFVAALPLAPLFALINNILEIRLDAYKMLVTTRKPIPAHAKNIGIWRTILEIMSTLAVLCNAFVIAFTSDFIPKLWTM